MIDKEIKDGKLESVKRIFHPINMRKQTRGWPLQNYIPSAILIRTSSYGSKKIKERESE